MTPAVAARLEAGPGEPAMRTRYTFTADGEPVMLSVSWEPLELTSGTPVMLPEEGPHAGRGVVERMAVIGQQITSAEEVVSARPALAAEADRLNMHTGGTVLTICRTYRTDERAVETADIVIPVERYSLVYEIPVGLPHRLVRPPAKRCVLLTTTCPAGSIRRYPEHRPLTASGIPRASRPWRLMVTAGWNLAESLGLPVAGYLVGAELGQVDAGMVRATAEVWLTVVVRKVATRSVPGLLW